MSQLRHGYTNRTRLLPGGRVEKMYDGPEASLRLERERECLTRLTGRIPVPEVRGVDRARLVLMLREVRGGHGQDLIEAGHAEAVLRQLGLLHARLCAIDTATVPGLAGPGPVVVHGDFGPQNVLIDRGEVVALVDWEFAHLGQPFEDVAWAEWIVRMHHPGHRDAIPSLLDASQRDDDWAIRHSSMVRRCSELLRLVERSDSPTGVELWRERLRATERWTE